MHRALGVRRATPRVRSRIKSMAFGEAPAQLSCAASTGSPTPWGKMGQLRTESERLNSGPYGVGPEFVPTSIFAHQA